jgi:hypothetical protein
MIESCEQTGHRRMITSAAASAQSALSLLCAAESEIKTIVQTGLCPGYSDLSTGSYPERSLRPFQKSDWKRISNPRDASYFRWPVHWIGRLISQSRGAK